MEHAEHLRPTNRIFVRMLTCVILFSFLYGLLFAMFAVVFCAEPNLFLFPYANMTPEANRIEHELLDELQVQIRNHKRLGSRVVVDLSDIQIFSMTRHQATADITVSQLNAINQDSERQFSGVHTIRVIFHSLNDSTPMITMLCYSPSCPLSFLHGGVTLNVSEKCHQLWHQLSTIEKGSHLTPAEKRLAMVYLSTSVGLGGSCHDIVPAGAAGQSLMTAERVCTFFLTAIFALTIVRIYCSIKSVS